MSNDVLVDTSVWAAHFRQPEPRLAGLLTQDRVLVHPLVLGEIACGTPPLRPQTLADLGSLKQSLQASMPEVLAFIEREQLFGLGCGLVDLLLLSSTLLTPDATLWTLDRRLAGLAERFGVQHQAGMH